MGGQKQSTQDPPKITKAQDNKQERKDERKMQMMQSHSRAVCNKYVTLF